MAQQLRAWHEQWADDGSGGTCFLDEACSVQEIAENAQCMGVWRHELAAGGMSVVGLVGRPPFGG
ncbi:hypothetical protein N9L68_02565 [bacterium]|nr:hypothetical protein [bacterium]